MLRFLMEGQYIFVFHSCSPEDKITAGHRSISVHIILPECPTTGVLERSLQLSSYSLPYKLPQTRFKLMVMAYAVCTCANLYQKSEYTINSSVNHSVFDYIIQCIVLLREDVAEGLLSFTIPEVPQMGVGMYDWGVQSQ